MIEPFDFIVSITVSGSMARPTCRLCQNASEKADYHCDKGFRKRFGSNCDPVEAAEWREHYLLLNAASANCLDCVSFWVAKGASLEKGTKSNPNWNGLGFAQHAKAWDVIAYLENLAGKNDAVLPRSPKRSRKKEAEKFDTADTKMDPGENSSSVVGQTGQAAKEHSEKTYFVREEDEIVWAAALKGDRESLEQENTRSYHCLEVRPAFDIGLPTDTLTWTLREFVKLKYVWTGKQDEGLKSVLQYLSDMEEQAMQKVIEQMSDDSNIPNKRVKNMMELLWSGRVIGHSKSESAVKTRELWRKAFDSEISASDFQNWLRENLTTMKKCLFDRAQDVCISHVISTRLWSLRMHCLAVLVHQEDVRLSEISQILRKLEDAIIENAATRLKTEGKTKYRTSEKDLLSKLLYR